MTLREIVNKELIYEEKEFDQKEIEENGFKELNEKNFYTYFKEGQLSKLGVKNYNEYVEKIKETFRNVFKNRSNSSSSNIYKYFDKQKISNLDEMMFNEILNNIKLFVRYGKNKNNEARLDITYCLNGKRPNALTKRATGNNTQSIFGYIQSLDSFNENIKKAENEYNNAKKDVIIPFFETLKSFGKIKIKTSESEKEKELDLSKIKLEENFDKETRKVYIRYGNTNLFVVGHSDGKYKELVEFIEKSGIVKEDGSINSELLRELLTEKHGGKNAAGLLAELKVLFRAAEEAEKKGIKTKTVEVKELDLTELKTDTLYAFSYQRGVTRKKDENGKVLHNSADINYTYNNISIDIEVKNSYNKYEKNMNYNELGEPCNESSPRQQSLYWIISLLSHENSKYSIGIYKKNFNGVKDRYPVYVDNTQNGSTTVKIDDALYESFKSAKIKFLNGNTFLRIPSYTFKNVSQNEIKRICSLEDFNENFIKPVLNNVNMVITAEGDMSKEQYNKQKDGVEYLNDDVNYSVFSDKMKEVGKKIKKNVTATGMAIAMATSKVDPYHKSSQNYQNTKIERQYNQNQEIFKAAKKSLDSIINFCKKYGLNNSLQEANRLLPLLNKKMAASVKTKYFNY